MKKYKTWEIVVATMLPLTTCILYYCSRVMQGNPSYDFVGKALMLVYSAIVIWAYCRMYLGGKASNRFPALLMYLLAATTVQRLFHFVQTFLDTKDSIDFTWIIWANSLLGLITFVALLLVTIRTYRERLTALAVTLTCILILPLLSMTLTPVIARGSADSVATLNFVIALLSSIAYAILFLHRNDLYQRSTPLLSE